MPFTLNPFSKKKIDFTQGIPQAPKELDSKKTVLDDEAMIRSNDTNTINNNTEKTIIKEAPSQELP